VVGLTSLAWTPALAAAIAKIRAELVQVRAEVRVADRAQVLSGVATGALDLGLIDGYAAPTDPLHLPDPGLADGTSGISTVAVTENAPVVALPTTHPLAGRAGLALADLAEAYWIDAPGIVPLTEVRAAAGLDGLRAGVRYEGADVAVLTGLIAAGHGLSLLPRWVANNADGLTGVPVSAPRLVHRVELLGRHATLAARSAGSLLGNAEPAARLAAMLAPP
jgi:DNA-binding transcriptional LysR family regulator